MGYIVGFRMEHSDEIQNPKHDEFVYIFLTAELLATASPSGFNSFFKHLKKEACESSASATFAGWGIKSVTMKKIDLLWKMYWVAQKLQT